MHCVRIFVKNARTCDDCDIIPPVFRVNRVMGDIEVYDEVFQFWVPGVGLTGER